MSSPSEPPFISLHTAIVLVTGAVIGLIVGGLTYLSDGSAPGAVLAALGAMGVSVPVLRSLIR
ncbi:hypothetical protein ACI2L1_43010 [Streptomyces sp. NPDC019531]|uniref:hypothetical protein n=1 Tax=Streptomyces sp. NPDC019531 TaxID=3365062 RepID=UPI0038510FFD